MNEYTIIGQSTGEELNPLQAMKEIFDANMPNIGFDMTVPQTYLLKERGSIFDATEPVGVGDLMLLALPGEAQKFMVFALGGVLRKQFRKKPKLDAGLYEGFPHKYLTAQPLLSLVQEASLVEDSTFDPNEPSAYGWISVGFFDFMFEEMNPDTTIGQLRTSERRRLVRLFELFVRDFHSILANIERQVFSPNELLYQLSHAVLEVQGKVYSA